MQPNALERELEELREPVSFDLTLLCGRSARRVFILRNAPGPATDVVLELTDPGLLAHAGVFPVKQIGSHEEITLLLTRDVPEGDPVRGILRWTEPTTRARHRRPVSVWTIRRARQQMQSRIVGGRRVLWNPDDEES